MSSPRDRSSARVSWVMLFSTSTRRMASSGQRMRWMPARTSATTSGYIRDERGMGTRNRNKDIPTRRERQSTRRFLVGSRCPVKMRSLETRFPRSSTPPAIPVPWRRRRRRRAAWAAFIEGVKWSGLMPSPARL
ncbi:hypothetical protein B0H14DRAFT_3867286 [Mycena olivaceomarginata]|nr:hypothetical protein B0H14DRAFT_3867286 [Mycena olivaceomarginata]